MNRLPVYDQTACNQIRSDPDTHIPTISPNQSRTGSNIANYTGSGAVMRYLVLFLAALLLNVPVSGQSIPEAKGESHLDQSSPAAHETIIYAVIDNPITTKSSGAKFTATVVDGGRIIPAGSHVVGRVETVLKRRALMVRFYELILPDGRVLPLTASLYSVVLKTVSIAPWAGTTDQPLSVSPTRDGGYIEQADRQQLEGPTQAYLALRVVEMPTENRPYYKVNVYFATDRKRAGNSAPKDFFGSERASSLSYGKCQVSIPKDHVVGKLESPFFFDFHPDPKDYVLLLSLTMSPHDAFLSEVAAAAAAGNKEILVFVHGYNVTFEEGARRTAQLAYDLQFNGVPILYSWPSKGRMLAYSADEASARWSAFHLKEFLQDLADKTGATTIHVVAHSLGNRALAAALEKMSLTHSVTQGRIREIVLASPDIDLGEFEQLASAISSAAQHVTIYASTGDWALRASNYFHAALAVGIVPGLASKVLSAALGLEFIDASFVKGDLLDHSYYSTNRLVLDDMGYVIREHLPASRRQSLAPAPPSNPTYWIFRR